MADSANLKCLKLSKDNVAVIDRISTLPDSLLSHILSFLPTKYAVGTSILSTRWKFLWTYITNVDFDDELYLHYEEMKAADSAKNVFVRFVYRVLLLLKPSRVHKFHLKCTNVHSHYDLHVNGWVSAAIERGVEELDLKIYDLYALADVIDLLPRTLFNCKTLTVLKLEGDLSFNISTAAVSLPCLKILHLIQFSFEDEECVHKLFRSCPVREDLVVERVYVNGDITFDVSSASLKRLRIDFTDGHLSNNFFPLQINTPALEYLDLRDTWCLNISLENTVSLVEAYIDVCIWHEHGPDDDYDDIVFELLKGLSNAKFLTLSRRTMEALSCASQFTSPMFHNLIRLEVSFKSKSREWRPLSSLLANSDNLEELLCN